jgi:peptidoglycan/xylan/chitin deacetylase (PgdA/CDA1 family)
VLRAAMAASALAVLEACGGGGRPAARASTTSTSDVAPATGGAPTSAAPAAPPPTTSTSATPATSAATGGPATYVNHAPATSDTVALTFHLGGDPTLVTDLLDLMRDSQLHVTAFAIGSWITAHPALGRRVVAEGHELGNHTEHHLSMLTLSRAQVRAEIVEGGHALVPFIGSIGRWFRPSGTDVPNRLILEEAGRAGYGVSVGYDIDSRDYTEPGAKAVIATVTTAMHPGAIVSMHFGHRDTIDALPAILGDMKSKGLRPVTIGQLLR